MAVTTAPAKKKTVKKVATKKIAVKKTAVKKAVASSKTVKPTAPTSKVFTLTLDMDNDMETVQGDTIIECLTQLEPTYFKTKAVILVTTKDRQARVTLYPFEFKRLLRNELLQQLFTKRINNSLK